MTRSELRGASCEDWKSALSLLHVIHSITFARTRKIADRISSVNQTLMGSLRMQGSRQREDDGYQYNVKSSRGFRRRPNSVDNGKYIFLRLV